LKEIESQGCPSHGGPGEGTPRREEEKFQKRGEEEFEKVWEGRGRKKSVNGSGLLGLLKGRNCMGSKQKDQDVRRRKCGGKEGRKGLEESGRSRERFRRVEGRSITKKGSRENIS